MKKITISLVAILLVSLSQAQENVNKKALQKISAEAKAEYENALQTAAVKYAEHPLDEGVALQSIDNNTPVYYSVDSKQQLRSMNVDFLSDGSLDGVNADGTGYIGYIWDGGKVRLTHQEFDNRVTQIENNGSNSDHATGVAGVFVGNGVGVNSNGIASKAELKVLNFTNGNTIDEIADESGQAENAEYMVSNHSYGALTGWHYNNSQSMWYWYGYPSVSETESVLFGFYTATDKNLDDTAFAAPQHSIFRSAGNNRGEGPGGVVDHYAFNSNGGWQLFSGVARPDDCTETGGYDCLAFSGSVAKNTINVAAVKNIPGDNRYQNPGTVKMTAFSSWGPTDDGRIKPEVSAIGESVKSATNTSDTAYFNWTGTSFSSPAAAGVGLILNEVKHEFDGGYLRSDMMKALLVNTANETGDDLGPDYKFGYGLINALEAAKTIINSDSKYYSADLLLANGGTYNLNFKALGDQPIKATIAWLDPAGTPLTQLVLNDRTPKLVNDLDLRITQGGTTYYPWKLDPDNPAAAATQEDNIVDNLEQVYIANPVPGQTYNLTVSHKGNLVNNQQYFALVISGVDSSDMKTNDFDLNSQISVYPNPVTEKLNIHSTEQLKNVHIKIFNEMGAVVYDKKSDNFNKQTSIDLNSVPAGVYMVFIKSDKGVSTKKIIKK